MTTSTSARVVPRVLLAKPGLDGHDRGIIIVARALRDAGAEVIYTGLRAEAGAIARSAVIEDVDVVGLSMSGGGHLALTRDVINALQEATGSIDLGGIAVMVGGNIPDRDLDAMTALGVSRLFGQSEPLASIVDFVRQHVEDRHGTRAQPLTSVQQDVTHPPPARTEASLVSDTSQRPRQHLTLQELWPGRVFGPQQVTIDESWLTAYRAVAGDAYASDVPEGLLGVLARRAYLAEHDMPPGGVMLGQDLVFEAPLPRDRVIELLAEVEEVGERKGRPYVRIRSTVYDSSGELAAVTTHALWPDEVKNEEGKK